MPDVSPRVLKGFRDSLPEIQLPKERMLRRIESIFESFGFAPIQTPALEYSEILLGKCGDEGDKLLYRFEDNGGRDVALRYDLTVPFARVMGQHRDLDLPFRRYQIAPVWRAEKPARGRFREFTQCDVDIAGSASLLADVEILQVGCAVLSGLGIDGFRVRLSNRKLLAGLLARVERTEDATGRAIIRIIDKLDKLDESKIRSELEGVGLPTEGVDRIFEFFQRGKSGAPGEILERAEQFFAGIDRGLEGVEELREVVGCLESAGIQDRVCLDLSLARGMDYYTGTIAEGVLTDLPGFGSVLGGGRYDDLVGSFRGQPVPAVGISVGIDRLLAGLQELELVPRASTPTQILVAQFDAELRSHAIELAARLRTEGRSVELSHEAGKLGKQFKAAHRRGIPVVVLAGPDEVRDGTVTLKVLETGSQETVSASDLPARLTEILGD